MMAKRIVKRVRITEDGKTAPLSEREQKLVDLVLKGIVVEGRTDEQQRSQKVGGRGTSKQNRSSKVAAVNQYQSAFQ